MLLLLLLVRDGADGSAVDVPPGRSDEVPHIPAPALALDLALENRGLVGHSPEVVGTLESRGTLPWGPLRFPKGVACPIIYPFANETKFCHSVGKHRALVEVRVAPDPDAPEVACVDLPWRRADDPFSRALVVTPAGGSDLHFLPASLQDAGPGDEDGGRIVGRVCFRTSLPGRRKKAQNQPPARANSTSTFAIYFLPYGERCHSHSVGDCRPAVASRVPTSY